MKKTQIIIFATGLSFLLISCASKKNAIKEQDTVSTSTTTKTGKTDPTPQATVFLKRILENQVNSKNVVGSMTFNVKTGSKDITVPGSLHMRRDEMIRLQLFIPLLGTEVGRVEFTPNRVLIINRMHKEYIEADYTQLDFLKNNGLTFYSLQALFWNQLLIPGKKEVKINDAGKFTANEKSIKLINGNMTYLWTTTETGQIVMTNVNYASAKNGASSLLWKYSNFKFLGSKQFPAYQDFQFSTTSNKQMKTVKVTLDMDKIKDKSDWSTETTISSKYKKVEATDVFDQFLNF